MIAAKTSITVAVRKIYTNFALQENCTAGYTTGGGDAHARARAPCACGAALQTRVLRSSRSAAPPASLGSAAPAAEDGRAACAPPAPPT
eukprot:3365497-Pleurochrysis_carterae.AAC.1